MKDAEKEAIPHLDDAQGVTPPDPPALELVLVAPTGIEPIHRRDNIIDDLDLPDVDEC